MSPGAIGLIVARSWVGKRIAARQGVPYSHSLVSLGDGHAVDQVFPVTRIRSLEAWAESDEIHWWEPVEPFDAEETRVLRAMSYALEGRALYSVAAIARLAFGWYTPWHFRPLGLYCTHLTAELYLTARDFDFSGLEQPWNVTPRAMFARLNGADFRRVA